MTLAESFGFISTAFTEFKNFKALVENQSGHKLVTLCSDRGGEYTSK
jgi:hypothetical protein